MKYGLFTALCLLTGCSATQSSPEKITAHIGLKDSGTSLYFEGETSKANVNALIEIASQSPKKIEHLIITSEGGDVYGGMKLGAWLFEQQISLTVSKVCFSSCANYVFTAAKSVIVEADSVVGWHGGSLQKEWNYPWYAHLIPWWKSAFNKELLAWQEKESALFAKLGVNQKITVLGQDKGLISHRENHGWAYSLSNLEILGVKNVTFQDGEPCLQNENYAVTLLDIEKEKLLVYLN